MTSSVKKKRKVSCLLECYSRDLHNFLQLVFYALKCSHSLIPGADICKHFYKSPIGKLTDKASEARSKEYSVVALFTFCQNLTKKIGRKQKMENFGIIC